MQSQLSKMKRPGAVSRMRRKQFSKYMLSLGIMGMMMSVFIILWASSIYSEKETEGNSPNFVSPTNVKDGFGFHLRQSIKDAEKRIANARASFSHYSLKKQKFPEALAELNGIRYHLVFSTDCSPYQHWQSYLLFYSALKVGQPGRVTRIASGCSQEEATEITYWHEQHIRSPLSSRFGLHLTPHFSHVKTDKGEDTGKDYKFFNKPFGLRHWLENGEHIRIKNDKGGTDLDEDAVVILIDPDMVLLQRITVDFSDPSRILFGPKAGDNNASTPFVKKGTPFAQSYGFGSQWKTTLNVEEVTGPSSPALLVTDKEARGMAYGPPYILVAADALVVARHWSDFVPKVHKQYPNLLAEMFAYCIAAAHAGLPHQIVRSLMVSDSAVDKKEGWELIDNVVPAEQICEYAFHLDGMEKPLPHVIHYCQRYMNGDWFFGKKRIPTDFFSCDSPLLEVPPMDLAVKFDYKMPPPPHPRPGEKLPISKQLAKRNAFSLCAMTAFLNEASTYFKSHACHGKHDQNLQKTMNLWHLKDN